METEKIIYTQLPPKCCVCQCSIYWAHVDCPIRADCQSITIGSTGGRRCVVPSIDQVVACPAIRSYRHLFFFSSLFRVLFFLFSYNEAVISSVLSFFPLTIVRFVLHFNLCASCPINWLHLFGILDLIILPAVHVG